MGPWNERGPLAHLPLERDSNETPVALSHSIWNRISAVPLRARNRPAIPPSTRGIAPKSDPFDTAPAAASAALTACCFVCSTALRYCCSAGPAFVPIPYSSHGTEHHIRSSLATALVVFCRTGWSDGMALIDQLARKLLLQSLATAVQANWC